MTIQEIQTKYETSVNVDQPSQSLGLKEELIVERRKKYGKNEIPPPRKKPWYKKYLECLINLFNLLLIGAGCGNLFLYFFNSLEYFNNVYIGSILIGIAFINTTIEFYEVQKIAAMITSFSVFILSTFLS